MNALRIYLMTATAIIFTLSIYVVVTQGLNWPVVYFGDIVEFDWRAQFNVDFAIHLILLAIWISWREGFTSKGNLFGFLSIFMGGMFGFPYLLHATYKAQGHPQRILLGVHAGT